MARKCGKVSGRVSEAMDEIAETRGKSQRTHGDTKRCLSFPLDKSGKREELVGVLTGSGRVGKSKLPHGWVQTVVSRKVLYGMAFPRLDKPLPGLMTPHHALEFLNRPASLAIPVAGTNVTRKEFMTVAGSYGQPKQNKDGM